MEEEEKLLELPSQTKSYKQDEVTQDPQHQIQILSQKLQQNTVGTKASLENIQAYCLFGIAQFLTLKEQIKLRSVSTDLREKVFQLINQKTKELSKKLQALESDFIQLKENPELCNLQIQIMQAEPVIQQALQSIMSFDRKAITEIHNMPNPPQVILTVVQGVCILFEKSQD